MKSLKTIIQTIKKVTGVDIKKIESSKSKTEIADAIRIYCLLATTLTHYNYSDIGSLFKRSGTAQNHSMVVYHKKKGLFFLEKEIRFKNLYNKCMKELPYLNDEKECINKIKYHKNKVKKYTSILQKLSNNG